MQILLVISAIIMTAGCSGARPVVNTAIDANSNQSNVANQVEKKPPLSPPATAETTVAGQKIVINYSTPSARGRKIVGGLVPFDQVWRTGANAATTMITDADLTFGTLKVPRGTYTIYSMPSANGWQLIINKQNGQWGTEYHQEQDLGRVDMKVKQLSSPVEVFKITLSSTDSSSGVLTLDWENTEASIPFKVGK